MPILLLYLWCVTASLLQYSLSEWLLSLECVGSTDWKTECRSWQGCFFFPAVWLNPSCGCSGLRYSQHIEHLRFLYYKPFSWGWRYKRIEAVLYPADYQGQQVLLSAETVVFCTHPHFIVFWCSWAELNYCREVVLLLSNSKLFYVTQGD